MTSGANVPSAHARAALKCERCAMASCSSRLMPFSLAIFSAASPISSPVVGSREKPGTGGMKSLPLTLEKAVSLAPRVLPFCAAIRASRSGREMPSGTSLMLSAPPAIATW